MLLGDCGTMKRSKLLTVKLFIEIVEMAEMCPRKCRTYVSLFKSQIIHVIS